jgi:homoserine O-acetyltransferase/O-succinyltransferase
MLLLASALLFNTIPNFPLESGKFIAELKLGYRTYGKLNAERSNAVLFPTWFNGTTADLEKYIVGDKGFVDTSKYFVIAVDAIGNGVSGPPKKAEFPRITIGDMVRSQYELVTKTLGIARLHAVMGISMGAMQGFEWIARYPEVAPKLVSIVGTPQMTAKDAMLWTAMVQKGAGMGGGGGAGDSETKKKTSMWESIVNIALSRAGQARGGGGGGMPMPRNVLRQFDALVAHNAAKHFGGSLERMGAEVKAPVLMIIADKDEAVSGETPLEYLRYAGTRAKRVDISGGHNAYKTQQEIIRAASLPFLDGVETAAPQSIFPQ